MKKLYCDRCRRDIDESDMHVLKVCNIVSRRPSVREADLCAFCKEKLVEWLKGG